MKLHEIVAMHNTSATNMPEPKFDEEINTSDTHTYILSVQVHCFYPCLLLRDSSETMKNNLLAGSDRRFNLRVRNLKMKQDY